MTTSTRLLPVAACAPGPRHPRSDDDLIACTLITLWALTTGRTLPAGVPPTLLSEHELITFWADPVLEEVRRP